MAFWILNEHLPPECSLAILAAACQGSAADRATLKALREVCRAAHSFMQKHKAAIIGLYTVTTEGGGRSTPTFCGKLHSFGDKPAMVTVSPGGIYRWCHNGYLHRDNDLPAVVYRHGAANWYRHGKLHRDGGPARVGIPGSESQYYWQGWRYYNNKYPILWNGDTYVFTVKGVYICDLIDTLPLISIGIVALAGMFIR